MLRLKIQDSGAPYSAEYGPGEIVLGRAKECTIRLETQKASRQHARIVVTAGGATLFDLESFNGITLNGARVTTAPLKAGDTIVIGTATIVVDRLGVPKRKRRGPSPIVIGVCAAAALVVALTAKIAFEIVTAEPPPAIVQAPEPEPEVVVETPPPTEVVEEAPPPVEAFVSRHPDPVLRALITAIRNAELEGRTFAVGDARRVTVATADDERVTLSIGEWPWERLPPAVVAEMRAACALSADERAELERWKLAHGLGRVVEPPPETEPDRDGPALARVIDDPIRQFDEFYALIHDTSLRGETRSTLRGRLLDALRARRAALLAGEPTSAAIETVNLIDADLLARIGAPPSPDDRLAFERWIKTPAPVAPEDEPPARLNVIADAWPRSPRSVGQQFGMNSRDTIPTEEAVGEDDRLGSESIVRRGKRYQIVGVRLLNPNDAPFKGTLTSPDLPSVREKVELLPLDQGRWFFLIQHRPDRKSIRFRVDEIEIEAPLPAGATVGDLTEAGFIVNELRYEQEVRAKFDRIPVSVELRDEAGEPLAGASLTFVQPKTGLIVTGAADGAGRWRAPLLAGEWQIFARAVVQPKQAATGETVVVANPRLYYMAATFKKGPVTLAPERATALTDLGERVAVSPHAYTEFLRHAAPFGRIGPHFMLEADVNEKAAPMWLRTTRNIELDVASDAARRYVFLSKPKLDETLLLTSDKLGTLSFDPSRVPGGATRFDVTLSFPDTPRRMRTFSLAEATEIRVPAGPARVELTVHAGDGRVVFAPYVADVAPGKTVDLTPTAFAIQPYYQESRGLMVWAALTDQQKKIVTRVEGIGGRVRATGAGETLFEMPLGDLRYHFTETFKTAAAGIQYDVRFELGEPVTYNGPALPRRVFSEGPAGVEVPPNLEAKARGMIPMIQKTLDGGKKYLARLNFPLVVAFEIRLPPEVGGLGGGGRIQLDLGEILEYAHETDPLPGAYTHELGHNFGFGHDPYMSMAPCAVDEGLYGTAGYLLLNGLALGRALDYLDRDADAPEWAPSPDVYAAVRMLYGPDAHNRLFDLQKKFVARLDRVKISIPEQQAAYYSAAARENTAWIFRAFGWPVFDYRVDFAREMMENQSLAGREALPTRIDGSWLTTWWMRGPMPVEGGEAPWKLHTWEGRYVQLATEEDFLRDTAYHLYLTVQSESRKVCFLSIGADVQVAFYLNGKRVSRVNAAPQFSMPVHDGYTMERANATVVPVVFERGKNALELIVAKPAGSRGMFIEIADENGKPMKSLGTLVKDGPEEIENPERVTHRETAPVFNPSFEGGMDAWIRGAKDGNGNISLDVDAAVAQDGKSSLRVSADGTLAGGAIQRIVLDEKGVYEVTAWIRTEGFRENKDEAWVHFFTGEPYGGSVARSQVVTKNVGGWQRVNFTYAADRRTVYIGCILKGGAGARAWFDGISVVKKK